jgi:hypothetical protein
MKSITKASLENTAIQVIQHLDASFVMVEAV